ncbi:hypothetical protein GCM10011397_18100 [Wenyingzhuangia marina]|nr:hypothetical protein GCM10011397_18100 [Wenyingzhuangia marina]
MFSFKKASYCAKLVGSTSASETKFKRFLPVIGTVEQATIIAVTIINDIVFFMLQINLFYTNITFDRKLSNDSARDST